MRGLYNILYLILIAALATNNFTVNNLFSSIEKKDASSHLFDDVEDGGYSDIKDILSFYNNDDNLWVNIPEGVAVPLLDGVPLVINGATQAVFDINGKVWKFKVGSTTYQAYLSKSLDGYNNHYCGYFTDQQRAKIRLLSANSQEKHDTIQATRFRNFSDVSTSTTVFTKAPKVENNIYTDCYCVWTWHEDTPIAAQPYYDQSSWFYNKDIKYTIDIQETVSYTNCEGTCIDYSSYNVNGPAKGLFVGLTNKLNLNASELDSLAVLVQYLNNEIGSQTFAFYAELGQQYTNGQTYWHSLDDPSKITANGDIVDFFEDFTITTISKFHQYFPVVSDGDSYYDIIFAPTDLWSFLQTHPNYNANTIDYTSFPIPHVKNWDPLNAQPMLEVMDYIEELYNYQTTLYPEFVGNPNYDSIPWFVGDVRNQPTVWLNTKLLLRTNIISCFWLLGMFEPFEYDLLDLIQRHHIMSGTNAQMKQAINNAESAGEAIAIYVGNEYDQYVGQYDTDCAFFLGFEYFKMYAEMLFEPAVVSVAISRFQKVMSSFKGFNPSKNIDDIFRLSSSADNLTNTGFNVQTLKNLNGKIPGGVNKTNLGKLQWDDAYKFKSSNTTLQSKIDDIAANGDNLGAKTEEVVDDIMTSSGYTKVDGKYFGPNGANGFDGVYIKGDIDNPTEIIIVESKQMSSSGSVSLNSPNLSTGLPSQMSDQWVNYVAEQKLLNIGGEKTQLANAILNSPPGTVQKYVVAVDKSVGEMNFLKLGNY